MLIVITLVVSLKNSCCYHNTGVTCEIFLKKPLKNTSVVAVRMTASKGKIQKMIARTYPCIHLCIYPCTYSRIHPCTYSRIYPCNYSRTYVCTHSRNYPCTRVLTRVFTSPVLYVVFYMLFFGLGKVHMVGTCLVIAGCQLIIYRVFIGYMLVIR